MKVVSINTSKHKGTRKERINQIEVLKDHGLAGDAHAGPWHRQISFLASESIESARDTGLDVGSGDFAENITTAGVDWKQIPIGTRLQLGEHVIVEITQIGKECHKKCAIYYQAGDCIMPREGIFGRVIEGGLIRINDRIRILDGAIPTNTASS
jgi:MOSC domain-containing protein YiiM